MSNIIYQIELFYLDTHTSWDFETAQKRDEFYDLVKENFVDKVFRNKSEALIKGDAIQLSIANVREDSLNSIADIVPYEYYSGESMDDLVSFINEKYSQKE